MGGWPKAVWAVFFASIAAFMGIGLVDPILPAISTQMGATPSQVALLFTSYNAVLAVAMLITGAVTTRLGIKKTLILGVAIIAIFSTLCGFMDNVWAIIGLRGGWGLGNALLVATALTAIITLSNHGTAKSVILYETAIGLGLSVGPLLGGLLGEITWRGPFIGVGVFMILAFTFLVTLMPSEKKEEIKRPSTSLLDPFRAMKHRPIQIFGLSACFYNFGFFTLLAYAPFVMGLGALGIGFAFLGWGVMVAITSVLVAPLLQRKFGTLKSMYAMLSLFAVILLVMGIWTSTQWVIIASVVVSGAFIGSNNTLITTAVMNATPIERSTASAAYSFLRFIGSAIAPFLAGLLAEVFSPHIPFLVGGCFVLASVVVVLVNRHHVSHVDDTENEKLKEEKVLKVKDFMVNDVVSVKPDATIKELLKLLSKHRIGGVPVVDDEDKLVAMVSDGDIIRYLTPKEGSVRDFIYQVFVEEGETEGEVLKKKIDTNVSEVIKANPPHKKQLYTIKGGDTLEKAVHILSQHHFKKLPVLDPEGKVVGIISRGDINNTLLDAIIK